MASAGSSGGSWGGSPRDSSRGPWSGAARGSNRRAAGAGALVVALGALWLAAGPGASALGTVRSMAERARPRLVAGLFDPPLSGAPSGALPDAPSDAPSDALPNALADVLPRALTQRGPRDCGPAALATILAWRGRPVGEDAVLRLAHLRADGITLAELARLASAFELPGAWYAVPPSRLDSLPTPFLAHLRAGHFVAVRRLVRGFVLLADPARGLLLERRARFVHAWSGRVLLFDAVLEEQGAARPALRRAERRP